MKHLKVPGFLLAGWVTASLSVPAAETAPPPLARWHFLGAAAALADTNAPTPAKLFLLPASQELKAQTLAKLTRALAASLAGVETPEDAAAALIRPLLEDLLASESAGEVRDGAAPEWSVAVRLKSDRAPAWRANVEKLLGGKAAAEWNAAQPRKAGGTNFVTFSQIGEWSLVSVGRKSPPALHNEMAKSLRTLGKPAGAGAGYWLKTDLDLARLLPTLGKEHATELPTVSLQMGAREDYLRSSAALKFATPGQWALEPWAIPTNTIHDSPNNHLVSFGAMRGFGPWLSRQPAAKELGLTPAPNQFFTWSHEQIPFQICSALPVNDPAEVMKRAADWVPRQIPPNASLPSAFQASWSSNRSQLFFHGLPVLEPALQPAHDNGRAYLVSQLFPIGSSTNPPPPSLIREVTSQTNLVSYDWEITSARLLPWRDLSQFASILAQRQPANTNQVGMRWLMQIAPELGNTVTVGTVSSPKELEVTRKSRLGLSSHELVLLAYWLDDPEFPALKRPTAFRYDPNPQRSRRSGPAAPVAPVKK